MGDRISISFTKDGEESVALFSHWGGEEFHNTARDYARHLKESVGTSVLNPLDRLEPRTVMVDFIREITKDMSRVESNFYLGKNANDGDNSDNGHYTVDLDTI